MNGNGNGCLTADKGNGFRGYQEAVEKAGPAPGATPGALRDGRGADDQHLLARSRHNYVAIGTAIAQVGQEGVRALAAELAPVVFSGTGEQPRAALRGLVENLSDPGREIARAAMAIAAPPSQGSPGDYEKWAAECLLLGLDDGPGRAIASAQSECLQHIRGELGELVALEPSLACRKAGEVLEALRRPSPGDPDPRPLLALASRYREAGMLSGEMTPEVWSRAQERFQQLLVESCSRLAVEVAGRLWHLAIRSGRTIAWVDALQVAARRAEEARLQAITILERIETDAVSGRGGRLVRLPGPAKAAVAGQVLAKRCASDLRALGLAYREAMAIRMPRSTAEAAEAAGALLDLIRLDTGSPSIWSHLGADGPAGLAGALLKLSHPPASLRRLESEFGVDPCQHLFILGPEPEGAQEAEARDRFRAEIERLAGCSVDLVPCGDPSNLRVGRLFAGFPSHCERDEEALRSAYIELAGVYPHRPHPFESPLAGPGGLMDILQSSGE